MNQTDKIYIAGHRGMVGSAIIRKLEKEGFSIVCFSGANVNSYERLRR